MRRHSPLLTLSLVPAGLGLLLLLGLSLLHLRTPDPRDGTKPATPTASESHPAAEHTRQFFGWPSRVQWQPLTNTSNPFFTLAIQPPPPPTPPPPQNRRDLPRLSRNIRRHPTRRRPGRR